MISDLLPQGPLWTLEPGTSIKNTCDAIGDEFERVRLRGVDLINESDPRTATETLSDWERTVGLPDARVPTIPATTAGRRVAITQKLIGSGGQNLAFFTALISACGWSLVSISLYPVLRAGFRVGDRCVADGFAYTMNVKVHDPGVTGALTSTQLEAVVRAATHIHVSVIFTYV